MDNGQNEKMGRFICELRKAQNMTQKTLAEKLNVTDKAVSKWERGQSCPDVSLIMPLAQALNITSGELLNGEKNPKENVPETFVDKALLYSGHSAAVKFGKVKRILLAIIFFSFIIATVVCLICDYFITGSLSWSLIVISSLVFSFLLLLPVFKVKEHIIRKFFLVLSAGILPYLYLLSILLKQPLVFVLGGIIAIMSVIWLWCAYAAFYRLRHRCFAASGIACLCTIPLTWGINYCADYYTAGGASSNSVLSDVINLVATLAVALICFGIDHMLMNRPSQD